jgi:hypothetical protein
MGLKSSKSQSHHCLKSQTISIHQQLRFNSKNKQTSSSITNRQKDSIHAIRTIRQVSICLVSSGCFFGWYDRVVPGLF